MFSLNDRVEMTAKFRLEHAQRGYDWHDMVEETEGLTPQDLLWARYPSDEELADVGVRGIYLGNYVDWEANAQTELMISEWGFEPSPEPFERTYRRMSNLDDMHENGIHDYLKYVKFGYGRGTDHACKDIRAGQMTPRRGDRDGRALRPRQAAQGPRALARVRRHDRGGVRRDRRHASATRASGPRTRTATGSRTRSARSIERRAAVP